MVQKSTSLYLVVGPAHFKKCQEDWAELQQNEESKEKLNADTDAYNATPLTAEEKKQRGIALRDKMFSMVCIS